MYLYFLPLPLASNKEVLQEIPAEGEEEEIQVPTSDGGVEVTAATVLSATEWLQKAGRGEIILYPPQYVLLHLVAQFLDREPRPLDSVEELGKRRRELIEFVRSDSSPPWTDKCISPRMLKLTKDGRTVLALDHPGPELKGTNRRGESDRVVIAEFVKGSVRKVEVRWKRDVLAEDREKSNL